MITLHAFGPSMGLPDGSPFVMKAMILLQMAGLDYAAKPDAPFNAPKGKLPYIEDDGEKIADSTFIRFHIEKKYGFDYDSGLIPEQKATGWALEKLCEDHLYWLVLIDRWLDDENFAKGPAHFFDTAPALLRPFLRNMVRGKIRKAAHSQGLFRHNAEERRELARRGVGACAALLGDKPYLFGDRPHGADATLGAFAMTGLSPLFKSTARDEMEKAPNLVAYGRRIAENYFPAKM
ncbi:glutathione S-transferase family protein [Rhodoblastus acidophilus]|uniref:Glutathione S-transferase family protein n=1 Tax=Candidatus Rhodoblastus alkanivorans TaxID=2954117 RepID=A0ABS9Z8C2_9HYPH|nr:glutathione S-transferase family protein [Candidatus Rhodoblastus alkanivorans]MCI4677974.1 glutathione S-transferase family protein [Candidatus Rhodoblastus alkanivorans]MCI4683869.1 glutathione S-transferase family protein [Candidatus Rhodoblastus alkanivorans]MDI4641187.1 glutathione S-transferase family protein [Rhodoblastus acidophilus]